MFKFNFCPNKDFTLESILEKKSDLFFQRWKEAKKIIVREIDNRYKLAFPNFEEKISNHGEQGICFLANILFDDLIESINEEEVFLLMSGCFLHDIGIVSEKKPFLPSKYHDHFELGEKIILSQTWLPFSSLERQVISKHARWHNMKEWMKCGSIKEDDVFIDHYKIRTHFLVQLIQLFDFYHHVVDVSWKNFPEFLDLEKKNIKKTTQI